jgi:hypothetical protein
MAEIELSVRRRNALTGVFQTSRSWNEVTAWEENAMLHLPRGLAVYY